MAATLEELPNDHVRLTVDVSEHELHHAVEHAANDLAANAKIPGFRKGKVPMKLLLQRVGKEALFTEAIDSHIAGWFWNAAAQTRIRPVEQPRYDYELPEDEHASWQFTATVAVQAKPALPDWRGLEVPAAEADVPEELVEQSLQELQATAADLSPVDGRGAQLGDVLVLDLVMDADTRKNYVVELGSGRLAQGLEAALLNAPAGEKRSVPIQISETDTSIVHATLNEIHEKVLPPLDDDFAKKVSEFDTLSQLRDDLTATLREQIAEQIEVEVRAAAVDKLVEATQVQVGGPLVEVRTRELLNGLARSVERRGISLDQYLALSGRSPEQLIAGLQQEAALSVARELVLESLADQENLEVPDAEVDDLVKEQSGELGEEELGETLLQLRENGGYERLREDLRLRKALDLLAGAVQRIPVDLARARDAIWTPEKENQQTPAKLWTPGSKEPV